MSLIQVQFNKAGNETKPGNYSNSVLALLAGSIAVYWINEIWLIAVNQSKLN